MKLATVIMIVPPHAVQALAAPLLRQYALDTLIRVPAHLSVLYPFVEYERLTEACSVLREIAAQIQPFDVTLNGYDQFPGAIFMTPVDPAPIQNIFRRIFARFPECPPYGGQFGNDLHPHMTVGQFENAPEQAAAFNSLPLYEPVTFHVDRLHVMVGIDNEPVPWLTHDIIPLGN